MRLFLLLLFSIEKKANHFISFAARFNSICMSAFFFSLNLFPHWIQTKWNEMKCVFVVFSSSALQTLLELVPIYIQSVWKNYRKKKWIVFYEHKNNEIMLFGSSAICVGKSERKEKSERLSLQSIWSSEVAFHFDLILRIKLIGHYNEIIWLLFVIWIRYRRTWLGLAHGNTFKMTD